jgi:hypothetical protein
VPLAFCTLRLIRILVVYHIKRTAGVDATGIGTDFDGIDCAPIGLDDVSKFPALTRALLEKGYSRADIKKVYGGNTLRLMREVEKVAARLSTRSAVPTIIWRRRVSTCLTSVRTVGPPQVGVNFARSVANLKEELGL